MKLSISLFGLLVILASSNVQAAIVYDLFFRSAGLGVGLDTSLEVAPGQTFLGVEAVVRETVTGGDTSALAAANVNGFGINIGILGADGFTSNKATNITGGQAAGSDDGDTFAYFSLAGGISPSADVGGVREFVLGTLDITAPTAGSTTFALVDPNPAISGDISTFVGGAGSAGLEQVAADSGGSFNPRSITLTAVPEPSGLALLCVASAIGFGRRRRR